MQTPSGIAQIRDLAKFLRKFDSIRFPEDDAKEPAAKVPPNPLVAQIQKTYARGSNYCNGQRPSVN